MNGCFKLVGKYLSYCFVNDIAQTYGSIVMSPGTWNLENKDNICVT